MKGRHYEIAQMSFKTRAEVVGDAISNRRLMWLPKFVLLSQACCFRHIIVGSQHIGIQNAVHFDHLRPDLRHF